MTPLIWKVEQALQALDRERRATNKHRDGGSQPFHHPADTALALVRLLNHEGVLLVLAGDDERERSTP
jgi:hypothetical protein